ncbi:hypothetical protein, partial [Escherichia coli]|uniref:hypothetical protein n=1 Tax=Escherichia coli TaxID=562 RepID=UPI001BFE61BC
FSDPGPVFHTIVSIKNDGHYFCRAGGNRPDGLNEPVTSQLKSRRIKGGINSIIYCFFYYFDISPNSLCYIAESNTLLFLKIS